MNPKNSTDAVARGAPYRLRVALSALCLWAASPAGAAAPTTQDSQGRPVRAVAGVCVEVETTVAATLPPECVAEPKRATYRILQDLIPQPWVTYAEPPAEPPTEVVRFVPQAAFAPDRAGLTPELMGELYGLLHALEAYHRVERVEVIGHGDGTPRAAYGQWLGEKRAESARNFLVARGVLRSMLEGRGEAASDATTAGRFEILVTVRGRR